MNALLKLFALVLLVMSGVAGVRADESVNVSGVSESSGNSSVDAARPASP